MTTSEQINQAKALLENEGYQVYNCASVDLIGAFNYHIKQVRELLADKKRQQEEIEKLKAQLKSTAPQKDGEDDCSDCAEEELAEQDFFEGKEGGVIRWKPQAEDDEEVK